MILRLEKNLEPKIWEEFLLKQPYTIFVQSPAYAEFYRSMDEEGRIWGIYNEANQLVAGTLIISVHARRGNFWLLPYGPIIAQTEPAAYQQISDFLLGELKVAAKQAQMDFIRISPFWSTADTNAWNCFKRNKLIRSPLHILAENTWLLDITPHEEDLLKNMEKNHRNLVRRCEKEGVRIEITSDPEAVEEFNRMHDVTVKRHNFHRFPDGYVRKEFNALAPQNAAVIKAFLPTGELDAVGIFMFYGTMSCYRHAASLMSDKRLPTSYAVQWAAIQEAKKRGCTVHNFWGIAPPEATKAHPFYGITHFKKGFGGYAFDLIPCHDLPISARYFLTWLIEKVRSIRRGFSH